MLEIETGGMPKSEGRERGTEGAMRCSLSPGAADLSRPGACRVFRVGRLEEREKKEPKETRPLGRRLGGNKKGPWAIKRGAQRQWETRTSLLTARDPLKTGRHETARTRENSA